MNLFFVYEFLCLFYYSAPPPVPSVSLLTRWHDVFPSEKVEFLCNITNSSEYTFTWSRDGRNIPANTGNGSLLTVTVGEQDSAGSYTCKAQHTATGRQVAADNSEMLKVHRKWDSLFVRLRGTAECEIKFPGSSMSLSHQQKDSQLCMQSQTGEPCTRENLSTSAARWTLGLIGRLFGITI